MSPSLFLGLLLVVLFGISAAAQTKPVYKITGVVVNAADDSPVSHCHLSPSPAGRNRSRGRQLSAPINDTEADEQGRFSLTLPAAGAWRLVASAPGYAAQAYDEHQGFSSAIVLTEQAPEINIRFRLPPEAMISGTVFDEAGEAVRNAQVGLHTVPSSSPDTMPPTIGTRSFTQTDDRGHYEFANLPAGGYRISVDTKPWYATSTQPRRADASTANTLDPSLDVAYSETWYPGVEDPFQAETVALQAGDNIRADFHLTPIPAVHLQIIPPQGTTTQTQTGRPVPFFPMIQRATGGGMGMVPTSITTSPQGQIDVGGLAPGLYQIRVQGQNQESKVALVEVSEGGVHTLDFNAPSNEANVTIHVNGAGENDRATQVTLINTDTGERVSSASQQFGGGFGRRQSQEEERPHDRILQIPPGRYEVVLSGASDIYLDGMTAQSAEVTGRFIKVHSGDSTLTLNTARGRASISGIAKIAGKPDVGAMVLLVPAGLDDPSSWTALARDQTNTDGSFDLPEVIPGQYILLAIDNGWQINWKDPTTLSHYLMHGVPLELHPAASVKQDITAQAP